mgnify:CR=1 FL=1
MTSIIDYDAGNVMSVQKACEFLGEHASITKDEKEILSSDHVILPGVGAFGSAMEKLNERGLSYTIKNAINNGIPFLGICLGLQLLFSDSEESPGPKGLGILNGHIKKIPGDDGLKIPHMGWNCISYPNRGRMFKGIKEEPYVYFVHSFYLDCDDKTIVTASVNYGINIDCAIESGNVFATQFHPEKSGGVGLKMLKNFLDIN